MTFLQEVSEYESCPRVNKFVWDTECFTDLFKSGKNWLENKQLAL